MSYEVRAPAKLNLCLHLGQTRADGFHELVSLFDSISLHDTLRLDPGHGESDSVICPGVPGENLVTRALRACRDAGLLDGPPVKVSIVKRVPVAAGMGGGSADAAAALRLIAEIYDRNLADFAEIAFALGADVPSQLRPGPSIVHGAGEKVVPVDARCLAGAERAYVIVAQEQGLSTGEVFRQADRAGLPVDDLARHHHELVDAVSGGVDLDSLCGIVENAMTPAILALRPELAAVPRALAETGACAAAFTGSGPTAFGIFDTPEAAEAAASTLAEDGHKTYLAVPVDAEFAKTVKVEDSR